QDEALVTHCGKLQTEDGRLDWSRSRDDLDRWVRAYTPAPGCWTEVAGERLRILALEPRNAAIGLTPGAVRAIDAEIHVACADGWAAVLRLQSPGKRAMDAADWLNGNHLPDRFGW